jgi:hypothetical protein
MKSRNSPAHKHSTPQGRQKDLESQMTGGTLYAMSQIETQVSGDIEKMTCNDEDQTSQLEMNDTGSCISSCIF